MQEAAGVGNREFNEFHDLPCFGILIAPRGHAILCAAEIAQTKLLKKCYLCENWAKCESCLREPTRKRGKASDIQPIRTILASGCLANKSMVNFQDFE